MLLTPPNEHTDPTVEQHNIAKARGEDLPPDLGLNSDEVDSESLAQPGLRSVAGLYGPEMLAIAVLVLAGVEFG